MSITVEKSEKDLREFRCITLSNSIKCVLVSDPICEHAAASMNVKVGSIHEDTHGLAHFLEHMLFMGTEKYPGENDYNDFLTKNSGYSNAFTSSENTNYFFKVSSDQFRPALDIFAQFFISPNFNADSIERELKAVDSEYNKNLLDDNWRTYQLIRSMTSSPFNHFGSGNSETLNIPGIRDMVIEFYQKYYSANLMTLALYGKESTEVLDEYARALFSSIPNKNIELPVHERPRFQSVMTITKIMPVKNTNTLKLVWAIPSQIEVFRERPAGYLSQLLGHEGKNSLLSYLKNENLAEELNSGNEDLFSCCSYIYVDIKLTEKGLGQYEHILEVVHCYINNLKSQSPQEWLFEEFKSVAFSQFTFKNKQDPFWYSQGLSSRLSMYPESKILTANELYETFSPELIQETINNLNFSNLQVYLISQKHDKSTMVEEQWYKAVYCKEAFGAELIAKLESPNVDLSEKQLGYPSINPFIPRSHEVLAVEKQKFPRELLKNEAQRVWYKPDTKFKTDKVYGQLTIYCNSCSFDVSPQCSVMAKIWLRILQEKIREDTYLADLGGLTQKIWIDNHGVKISLDGFSEKYPNFFQFLIKSIAEFETIQKDEALFNDLKAEMLVKLKNTFYQKPYEQVQRLTLDTHLSGGYFLIEEELKALENIEFQDILWFSPKWLKNVYFEWLIVGNISPEAVIAMAESSLLDFTSAKPHTYMLPEEFLIMKITKVPVNKPILFKTLLAEKSDTNSGVASVWQLGPSNPSLQAFISLTERYLEEPCFNMLRTKEQLGYIVWSYEYFMRGTINFTLVIQTSVQCPSFVFSRISEFIGIMGKELENLDEENYSKMVKSTLEGKLKKDISLEEEFKRFKYEVDSAAYFWDRKQQGKVAVKALGIEQFRKNFVEFFLTNPRRIDIEALSDKFREEEEKFENNAKIYENISDFRRDQSVWPQVYIRK